MAEIQASRKMALGRARIRYCGHLDYPQLFAGGGEDLAAFLGDDDRVLDADAAEALQVNAGFDGDGHAGLQAALVALAEPRRFMDFEAESMAGGVDEGAIEATAFENIARGGARLILCTFT